MSLLERIHAGYVATRRARSLSIHLAELIPPGARVLDVGCGDGELTYLIGQRRLDIEVKGIDVLVRPMTWIPVAQFDGQIIPYGDNSFDVVMFVDVLHHTEDPMILLREAARVARLAIVLKDHTCNGWMAYPTLRLMDEVSNMRHGVVLPFNYWSRQRWLDAFSALGLRIGEWKRKLWLYPWPARWLFDRSLHFVTRLDV